MAQLYGPRAARPRRNGDTRLGRLADDPHAATGDADKDAHLRTPAVDVPPIVNPSARPSDWLRPVEGDPLTFAAHNAGAADGVTFRPLYDVHHQRFSVYWPLRGGADE